MYVINFKICLLQICYEQEKLVARTFAKTKTVNADVTFALFEFVEHLLHTIFY